MSTPTIVLNGTFTDAAGDPQSGRLSFRLNHDLVDSVGNVVSTRESIVSTLDAEGRITDTDGTTVGLTLYCTSGGDIAPAGLVYDVKVEVGDRPKAKVTVALPSSLGASVDWADLVPVPASTGVVWTVPDLTDEQARDLIGSTLVAGSNVTITVDDVANTVTITGAESGLTQEQIEDLTAALIDDNSDLDWTYDDASASLVAVIKPGAVTAAKVAADVATQAELDNAISALSGTYVQVGSVLGGMRAVAIGDSITQGATGNNDTFHTGNSWFNRMCHASGQRLLMLHNGGVAGEDTTEMLARVATDVLAEDPDICFVLGGTNDIGARGWTVAQAAANLTALYSAIRSAGIPVVAMTIPPRTAFADKTTQLNAWIKRYAAVNRMPCIDVYGLLVNPSDQGWADATHTSDGVHPSEKGSEVIARHVWTMMQSLVPLSALQLASDNDDAANLVTNGLFVGSAPAGVPTGWNAAPTSIIDGTDGLIGKWAEFVTSGNVNFRPSPEITAGFTPGDRLAFACAYQLDAIAGNFSCRVYFTSSGGSTGDLGIWQGPKQWTSPTTPGVLNVAYMEDVVPANTATIRVEIASTTAGATWRVGQVSLLNLTTLGLPSLTN